ncbi:MAG: ATP phosphoribosyltransferase [Polyangiales bacterium]
MRVVTIAVPKGRVLKALVPVFARLGVDPAAILSDDRRLMREIPELGWRFLLLKPDDVPTYVEYGAADLGVCGRDVLLERGFDLYQPVDLGIGRCQMVVATAEGMGELPDPPRIATKYPRIAAAHFAKSGVQAEVVYVQGSVELAPLTGLADAIVDLVETGETLRQNHLTVREVVAEISSVLVANRAALKLLGARARQVIDAFASTDSAASIART